MSNSLKSRCLSLQDQLHQTQTLEGYTYLTRFDILLSEQINAQVSRLDEDYGIIVINSSVEILSDNLLLFILAHEMAHLVHHDYSFRRRLLTSPISREIQADMLALKAIKELGVRLTKDEVEQLFSVDDHFQSGSHPVSSKRNKYILDFK